MRLRTVTLPAAGITIGLGTYIAGVKHALDNPDLEYKHGLTTWTPTTGSEIRQQFRDSIHDRINQATPYLDRGMA
tara:strand:+ start:76 stop:300 length:225 start_codon:yes stop_codon:yes gene_type:complete